MTCFGRRLLDGLHLRCPSPPLAPTNIIQNVPAELRRSHVVLHIGHHRCAVRNKNDEYESERRQGMGCQEGKC